MWLGPSFLSSNYTTHPSWYLFRRRALFFFFFFTPELISLSMDFFVGPLCLSHSFWRIVFILWKVLLLLAIILFIIWRFFVILSMSTLQDLHWLSGFMVWIFLPILQTNNRFYSFSVGSREVHEGEIRGSSGFFWCWNAPLKVGVGGCFRTNASRIKIFCNLMSMISEAFLHWHSMVNLIT